MAIKADAKSCEAIQKLEEQVNCSICLNNYQEPKLLQCSHVYSKLEPQVSQQQHSLDSCKPFSLISPTCCEPMSNLQDLISSNLQDLASPKQDIQENLIIDVFKASQKSSGAVSDRPRAGTEVNLSGTCTVSNNSTVFCSFSEHSNEVCSLFCMTCNSLICALCTIEKHHLHNYNATSVEFEKSKLEVMSSLLPLDGMVQKLEEGLSNIAARGKSLLDQKAAIKVEVCSKMKALHQVLNDRLAELMDELELVYERKVCSLTVEKDHVTAKLRPLSSFRDSIRESVKSSREEDLLKTKKSILKKVQQRTSAFQPETVVFTKADMKFSSSSYVDETCRYYGKVYAPGSPHPAKCRAQGEGLETATLGAVSMLQLTIFNYHGELCEEGVVESLECKLESKISGAILSGSVARKEHGQFLISYFPTFRGEHLLHIKVEGEHIRESPFAVKVGCPIECLSTPVCSVTGLNRPCGVTFTPTGDIVIAEKDGQDISVLSSTGQKLRTFNVSTDAGAVIHCGVAVDKQGNIIVVDTHKHHIRKFTSSGEFIAGVGSMGSGIQQFLLPHDVAFNAADNRLYIIDENNRVQVLNSDLSFCRMFGKRGNREVMFNTPHGIACSKSGTVYVADTNNHRVVAFNSRGKYLKKYVKSANDVHFSPISVAVDANDFVYVAEADNCISIFSPEGMHMVSFGKDGNDSTSAYRSFALAVHRNGMIYVCDTDNDQVQII